MKAAWLFPGQGSQSVGMARDVLDSVARRAARLRARRRGPGRLWEGGGGPLSRLILEGPEEELTLTANAQPALVATSCAILAAIREQRARRCPTRVRGGALARRVLRARRRRTRSRSRTPSAWSGSRGQAMQEAVPPGTGAMAAIMGIEPARLEALCAQAAQGEVVSPANFNAPGQIVVAGHAGAVARLGELVDGREGTRDPAQGQRSVPLRAHGPRGARRRGRARANASAAPPLSRSSPTSTRAPTSTPARAKELLVRQVDGAVRWDESVRLMAAEGVTHALEIGPGKVLAGLVKRIAKEIRVLSVGDAASIEQVSAFLAEASG